MNKNNQTESKEYLNAKQAKALEQTYPSIELGYQIAISSYDSLVKRLDALDGKIQTLLTLGASACFFIPTLGKVKDLPLYSPFFIAGISLLTISIVIGIYARMAGKIKLLSPQKIYDDWLHLQPTEFKKDLIFFAISDYRHNADLLEYKWKLNLACMIILIFALVSLAVWVAGN